MSLRAISIKRKLMAILLASTTAALLLVAIAILAYEYFSFRAEVIQDLLAQTEIIGNDSITALASNNKSAAEQNLSALSAKPNIVAACLYRRDAKRNVYTLFAT